MDIYHKTARNIQRYLDQLYAPEDDTLAHVRLRMEEKGMQPIAVTALLGKTLSLFSKMVGAERILEIGTLCGYSSLWLARTLPSHGRMISLEMDPKHVKASRESIREAGLENLVEVREGKALELMKGMIEGQEQPFDLIFLDADKQEYPNYIEPMIALSRPGGLIIADNLIRRGKVINPPPHDAHANALAQFNRKIAEHPKLESVILPTLVGYLGGDLDGLSLSRVRS
jgi:caffeoyl-CoA O-methyltransferase